MLKSTARIACCQLLDGRARTWAGVAGVAFSVILILMQLCFQAAVYEGVTGYQRSLIYDLVMVNPATPFIGAPRSFSRRRLYQVLAEPGVRSVSGLYIQRATWKNPWQHTLREILVWGVDPQRPSFAQPELLAQLPALHQVDRVLFDLHSRSEFGPVAQLLGAGDRRELRAEVNRRSVRVAGLFSLGTSFGIEGNLVTSDLGFRRLFPAREAGEIDLGLIRLRDPAAAATVREALRARLESDVLVLTAAEYVARESRYWQSSTPIGYVVGFGSIMGLIVGCVIVYQILFAEVRDHLREYATLKAIGHSGGFLSAIVLWEAAALALLGYFPGLLLALGLCELGRRATHLPLAIGVADAGLVAALALGMCAAASLLALRVLRRADPAEVFA